MRANSSVRARDEAARNREAFCLRLFSNRAMKRAETDGRRDAGSSVGHGGREDCGPRYVVAKDVAVIEPNGIVRLVTGESFAIAVDDVEATRRLVADGAPIRAG